MTVHLNPLLENWFLLAKPNSKFFNDMWAILMETLVIGKDEMD